MDNHTEDKCFVLHPELKRVKRQRQNESGHQTAAITAPDRPMMPIKINEHSDTALLDSASTASIISKKLANYLNLHITPLSIDCKSFTGHSINILGTTTFKLTLYGLSPSISKEVEFYVADNIQNNLLMGVDTLMQFHLSLYLDKKQIKSGEFTYSYNKEVVNATDIKSNLNNTIELLVQQYRSLFEDRIGKTPKYKFKIRFKHEPPRFHKKPFRIPFSQQKEIEEQIEDFINKGILIKKTSSYTSSAFTVQKPDKSNRLVVDYSKTINKWIERHYFPIPTIDDLLHKIVAFMIFTKLDCRSGFYHIELDEDSQQYTAFSLPWGTYMWKRMPMGISTAPEAFQEFMNSILGHLPFVLVYIDDILIMSSNIDQHYQHLSQVFHILHDNDLVLKKSKCIFAAQELPFLGFILSQEGLKPDPSKVQALLAIPPPTNKSKLRSIIGCLQWFRRFIPQLATHIALLTDMTSKKAEFLWTEQLQHQLNICLDYLAKATLLYYPNFSLPFHIRSDASDVGIGAVVYQIIDDTIHPVHFYSKKLSDTQVRNMSIVEKEAYAIISILEHLRSMLLGQQLKVYCDNKNVMHMENCKGRLLQRISSQIAEYSPDLIKIEGKDNAVADLLSRIYEKENNQPLEVFSIEQFPLSYKYISVAQKQDPTLSKYINYLQNLKSTTQLSPKDQNKLQYLKLQVEDGHSLLVHDNKLFIPQILIQEILIWTHNIYQHPGQTRFISILSSNLFWDTLHKDAKQYCAKCLTCKKGKTNPIQYGTLTPTNIQQDTEPFEVIAIDIQGPLPMVTDEHNVTYQYIFSIIDIKSRWVELIPLHDHKAVTVCNALDNEWFSRYPRPRMLLSDQAQELIGKELQDLLASYGVSSSTTTAYQATANSICERVHKTINEMIRTLGEENWFTEIQAIAFALRASTHSALKTSPSLIIFGLDMVLPQYNQNKRLFKENHSTVTKDLQYINKKRVPHQYRIHDLILLRKADRVKTSKWDSQQEGPYKVVECHNNNTLTINKHGLLERVNYRRVIPWERG